MPVQTHEIHTRKNPMKTTTLRKFILAGSLGICAIANAASTDLAKSAESSAKVCIPVPSDEHSKLMPRPFPMPHLLAVSGDDGGCILLPSKLIRPVSMSAQA